MAFQPTLTRITRGWNFSRLGLLLRTSWPARTSNSHLHAARCTEQILVSFSCESWPLAAKKKCFVLPCHRVSCNSHGTSSCLFAWPFRRFAPSNPCGFHRSLADFCAFLPLIYAFACMAAEFRLFEFVPATPWDFLVPVRMTLSTLCTIETMRMRSFFGWFLRILAVNLCFCLLNL